MFRQNFRTTVWKRSLEVQTFPTWENSYPSAGFKKYRVNGVTFYYVQAGWRLLCTPKRLKYLVAVSRIERETRGL